MNSTKYTNREIRKWTFVLSVVLGTIFVIIYLKHNKLNYYILLCSAVVLVSSVFAPSILRPFYLVWIRLTHIIGWINTHILLAIIFFFVFTPVGVFYKILGKDPLDRKIKKDVTSYWKRKASRAFDPKEYEKQF